MIGKQFQSSDFKPVLEYVHNKSGAKLISSNMVGKEPVQLTKEFKISKGYGNRVKKCVYHVSLSASPLEKLSDEKWAEIGQAYLKKMEFDGNQYVIYRHTDREHEHIHIIASRVRVFKGSVVSDSWNYRRSEKVIRELEKQFNLLTPSSRSVDNETVPTVKELRVKNKLKQVINQTLEKSPSLDEFTSLLNDKGISVRYRKSPEETINGISFRLDEIAFQGSQLGKEYCWKSIEKDMVKPIKAETNMNSKNLKSVESKKLDKLNKEKKLDKLRELNELDRRKQLLREKYLDLISQLLHISRCEKVESKELDVEVAILALQQKESLSEIKHIMTQSNSIVNWKEELAEEEYLKVASEYVEEVVEKAERYLKKERSKEDSLSM